jgi:ferric-dicitrate binding protein FerR (iron transport regulator)
MTAELHNLIVKHLSGNITEEEAARLKEALKVEETRIEFERLSAVWKNVQAAPQRNFDPEAGWQDFQNRLATRKKQTRSLPAVLRIAAGFVLIFCLIAVIMLVLPGPQPIMVSQAPYEPQVSVAVVDDSTPATTNDVAPAVPVKKDIRSKVKSHNAIAYVNVSSGDSARVCILPDGSHVVMNKQTTIKYADGFQGPERLVELQGEAFFDVMTDSKPFRIKCGKTITTVLGTSFNIKGYDPEKQVEVMVVTGLVQVVSSELQPDKAVFLHPGDAVSYKAEQAKFVKGSIKKKDKWWERSGVRRKLRDILLKLFGKKKYLNDDEKH